MSGRIAIALLTGVAVAAACFSTDASAFGRGGGSHGGGGLHGGGGFHGGGMHGGGFHVGGVHGLGHRGLATHGLATHGLAAHEIGAHRRIDGIDAGHGLAGHDRFGSADRLGARGQFAHNRFADARFHGLHDFNRTGFNRNAFGNGRGWNRWGGRFWGAGWNNWGGGWGGWAGPVFWPFLYGDIFSFALWPYDYYDPFWAFGPDFVLASIYAPGPYFGYGYGPYYAYAGPDIYYGTTRADRRALAQTSAAALQSCSGLAPGVTDLPISRIRKTVRPSPDQAAALDGLSAAATQANAIVKASCPAEIPLTPVARLDAVEKRLKAMVQAVQVLRGPLEKFYASLNDEQKQRFEAMGHAGRTRTGSTAADGNLAALCGEREGDVAKLPVQRIEQVVEPNAQQQAAFDAIKKVSEDTADRLKASCPAQMPQTPVARLDAVKTRLSAMADAIKTIRPALENFYASLSDEQKAKFNSMGPPPQNASSEQQRTAQ